MQLSYFTNLITSSPNLTIAPSAGILPLCAAQVREAAVPHHVLLRLVLLLQQGGAHLGQPRRGAGAGRVRPRRRPHRAREGAGAQAGRQGAPLHGHAAGRQNRAIQGKIRV